MTPRAAEGYQTLMATTEQLDMKQRTLAGPAVVEGLSLFTAEHCRCIMKPAPVNRGIAFVLNGCVIPVLPTNISSLAVHPAFEGIPARCSAVGQADDKESTVWLVEHVLSALAGLGINNCVIEVDHAELPIVDGSSLAFVDAVLEAGIVEQDESVEAIRITEAIRVERGDAWIEALPAESISYQYTIDYGSGSPIQAATVGWDWDSSDYRTRVAPSRTFCLEHEAEMLQSAGLFSHLKPGDMLVLGDDGPIGGSLRHEHECGLHKLLDLIGDVALVGKPVIGRIRAHKSGHALAHEFARAIYSTL